MIHDKERKCGTAPTLEVLICTHNRSELLRKTLHYLNEAKRPKHDRVRIVVAANACTDDTTLVLRDYEANSRRRDWLPLRWCEVPMPGKSVALNTVLPTLDAGVVAFVDDDHRVDRSYLVEVTTAVRECPDVNIFCGRILPDWDGSEPAWVHDEGPYRIYPLPVARFDQGDQPKIIEPGTATPGGGDWFLRTSVFASVGGFRSHLGPVGHNLQGGEDIEWLCRAVELGETLKYIPTVIQYHYVDPERLRIRYLIRKSYERTLSTTLLSAGVGPGDRIPPYMFRKLMSYGASAFTSINAARRRHYLVRLAAAAGELRGFLRCRGRARDQREEHG